MTRQKIINAAIAVLEDMRGEMVPRDTGNMAFNALQYKVEGKYMTIYFNTKIAPYIPYTNEPWIAEKWHGKKNPNEGWWDNFAQVFIGRLAHKLGGDIKL